MKQWIRILTAALLIALSTTLIAPPLSISAAALYEYYNTGDDGTSGCSGVNWVAQTFTPSTAHRVTSVKLLLFREGSPGTVTVSIRATSGMLPTGGDLCVGTTNGNTLPTGSPYEWREITLGDGYALSAGTKYAIVVRGATTYLKWRYDYTSATYAGGEQSISSNSGGSWSWTGAGRDMMFEEWGVVAPTVTTQAVTSIAATTATGNGNITNTGGEDASAWGICWNTISNPTTANSTAAGSGSGGAGAFTASMTELSAGTLYYVKAYATNQVGTSYGEQVTFYTLPGNPSTLTATAISSSQVNLTWTKGTGSDKTHVRRKVGSYPTSVADGDQVYFDTGTSHSDINRSPGTSYYYRAWAYDSDSSQYSSGYAEDYATTSFVAPSVTTDEATNVAYTTARLNSTLTSDGGEACEVRFQYNTSENWTAADNTTWVAGFTTGQHPYVDLGSLTFDTLYYFRVQAKNSIVTANGTSKTFTTEKGVFEPTNFKSFPEATEVSLSWTKGGGSTETLIMYKEGTYPTSITDGSQAYLGTSSSCVHSDLSSGHTYYYSAWGKSEDSYSDNYTTVMATTLPRAAEGETPGAPDMPPTWFQTPDYTDFAALPFYDVINAFYDAYEMPRASGWFLSTILGCIVFAILVFAVSNHPMPAMIALAVAIAVVSLVKLVPMWMMAFTVIFMIGAFQFGRTR